MFIQDKEGESGGGIKNRLINNNCVIVLHRGIVKGLTARAYLLSPILIIVLQRRRILTSTGMHQDSRFSINRQSPIFSLVTKNIL